LSSTKVIMGVVARDHAERVVGVEPFVEAANWWHVFPVKVAFTTTKDVNIKLSLESMEVVNLQVVVSINGKSGHIAEDKSDVAREFGTVKRVTKGLIVRKSTIG